MLNKLSNCNQLNDWYDLDGGGAQHPASDYRIYAVPCFRVPGFKAPRATEHPVLPTTPFLTAPNSSTLVLALLYIIKIGSGRHFPPCAPGVQPGN